MYAAPVFLPLSPPTRGTWGYEFLSVPLPPTTAMLACVPVRKLTTSIRSRFSVTEGCHPKRVRTLTLLNVTAHVEPPAAEESTSATSTSLMEWSVSSALSISWALASYARRERSSSVSVGANANAGVGAPRQIRHGLQLLEVPPAFGGVKGDTPLPFKRRPGK
eukprot:scaffold162_cov275-Pinguiococcus_pyrenoidosus.AAC.6